MEWGKNLSSQSTNIYTKKTLSNYKSKKILSLIAPKKRDYDTAVYQKNKPNLFNTSEDTVQVKKVSSSCFY